MNANTLYCIVHKDDASWMIGDILGFGTEHAVKHRLYDLDNVRNALRQKNMVCLKLVRGGTFEAFNPFIPA